MATDYDTPRTSEADEIQADSLEGLKAAEKATPEISDTDDGDIVEPFELPEMDLSGEELSVSVIPKKTDEFTCGMCFLVQHRSHLAYTESDGTLVCVDCE